MKTEDWSMQFRFRRPPRWNPEDGARPLVVYLDQWCWKHLLMDRAGEPENSNEAGLFEEFRRAADDRRAVFVLSQAHYRENWARENEDAMWDTAVAMAELSGFNAISVTGVAEWDAEVAVAAHFGLETPSPPQPFGWGFSHCLGTSIGPATIVDSRTMKPPDLSTLDPELARTLVDLGDEAAYRVELAILARREPRLEVATGLRPFGPVADAKGSNFADEQKRIAAIFEREGRRASMIYDTVAFQAFREGQELLEHAAERLGCSHTEMLDQIAGEDPTTASERLHTFMDKMPVSSIFNGLRAAAHLKSSFQFAPSDVVDFWAAATVLPFVDVFVTDKRTYNLINEIELAPIVTASVHRKLIDVAEHIRAATDS